MAEFDDTPLSFKVTGTLKSDLQKLAEADKRPLSQYLRIVLEEHVAAKKAAGKSKR